MLPATAFLPTASASRRTIFDHILKSGVSRRRFFIWIKCGDMHILFSGMEWGNEGMKYAGIIFDLDGVLCSTDEYHYRAWKMLTDRLGIPFDRKVNERLRGVSRMESLEIILEKSVQKYSNEEKQRFAEEKNENYRKLLSSMSSADLSAEVVDTLGNLRAQKVKLAVGSSSCNAPLILKKLELDSFFDAVVDGNDIIHSKPSPEVFLKAAERLKLPPSQCLVVEDAEAGVQAAAAGGFDCAVLGQIGQPVCWRLKTFSDLLKL